MGNILEINKIAENREKAKKITSRVIERGDKENLRFGDILQEEIDKVKKKLPRTPTKVVQGNLAMNL